MVNTIILCTKIMKHCVVIANNTMNKLIIKLLLIICLIINFSFVLFAQTAKAEADMPAIKNPFDSLQVSIPGMAKFTEAKKCSDDPTKLCFNWIGEYIAGIYNYAIGIVGILATITIMIGGVIWLTAGGNSSKIGEAKAWIVSSLTGLLIALTSYMVLYQINPEIIGGVSKSLQIAYVDKPADDTGGDSISPLSTNAMANATKAGILTSGSIKDIAASAKGKVTYSMGKKMDLMSDNTVASDCSGYAQFLLSTQGVSIPGYTGDIFAGKDQKTVSAEQLKNLPAGTLVGWISGDSLGSGAKADGHVLIATGDGNFTDSHGGAGKQPGNAIGLFSADNVYSKYGQNGLRIRTL